MNTCLRRGLLGFSAAPDPAVSIAAFGGSRALTLHAIQHAGSDPAGLHTTARPRGSERIVIYKHALRNAMLPVITLLAFRSGLIGGSVIFETIFSIPGWGSCSTCPDGPRLPVVMGILVIGACSRSSEPSGDVSYALADRGSGSPEARGK